MNDDRALTETELLYQRDSGLRSVEATVVGVEPESRLVALDKTVVFPGGGGQPSDEGTLTRSHGRPPMASALGAQSGRRRLARGRR